MSDRSLQALLDRLSSDESFQDSLATDPHEALKEFELSTVELFALTCGDPDSLRRLVGKDPGQYSRFAFREAMMAAFDPEVAGEVQEATAGGNTSKVTSQGVTTCCWP